MTSIAIVYSENTPEYPASTRAVIDQFRNELFPDFDVIDLELPPYYAEGSDVEWPSDEELAERLADCVAIFAQPANLSRRVIETAPELKVIAVMGSGYERVDIDAATDNGIVVTHNPEAPAPFVAEFTVMAMLSLLRELDAKRAGLANGEWETARTPATALCNATVGIVGLGNIGFRVAELITAFDAEIIGYDPYLEGTRESRIYPRYERKSVDDLGVELTDLETVCERADVLTLHVPHTDETRGMIGEAEFERLGDGYLINTSRGPVVDEDALIDAIEHDRIAGAAIDTFVNEPPSPDNPLLRSESVIATPHVSGVVDGVFDRSARLGAEKITALLAGEAVDTVVNPEVFDRPDCRVDLR